MLWDDWIEVFLLASLAALHTSHGPNTIYLILCNTQPDSILPRNLVEPRSVGSNFSFHHHISFYLTESILILFCFLEYLCIDVGLIGFQYHLPLLLLQIRRCQRRLILLVLAYRPRERTSLVLLTTT